MHNLLFPFIAFAVSASVAAVVLIWLLTLCHKRGLYDLPSARKVHQSGVPRLGGVVFVPAMLVGGAAALFSMQLADVPFPTSLHPSFAALCVGGLLLYFIGVVDDLFTVSAQIKFAVQILVAVSFPVCGLYIDSLYGFLGIYALPVPIAWVLTTFILLLIINAVNLIDGIDGLAGSLALVALGLFSYNFFHLGHELLLVLCASLSGAVATFLAFNLFGSVERKTKTFMGDSGSLLLGVALGYLVVLYAQQHSTILPVHTNGLVVAYSALLVPCLDLCRVALCRMRRRQPIFKADKTHLHHKLLAAGLTMPRTLCVALLMQGFLMALNLLLHHMSVPMEWIVLADVAIYALINIVLPVSEKR